MDYTHDHEMATIILKYRKPVKSFRPVFVFARAKYCSSLSMKACHVHVATLLLSAYQFMASNRGKSGKFIEFVHLHGADPISQKLPKF